MKKSISFLLVLAMVLSLCACGSNSNEKEYYQNTELEKLETFTSITGIELNISQDWPESNSIGYNYLMDNDAKGLGAVLKYETYLQEYGFEKSDTFSTEVSTTYIMGNYVIVTGTARPQDNVIQYVISIPRGET